MGDDELAQPEGIDAVDKETASVAQLVADGFEETLVRRISGLVGTAEYKRRQSRPDPRMTRKAFDKDGRLPITNADRG